MTIVVLILIELTRHFTHNYQNIKLHLFFSGLIQGSSFALILYLIHRKFIYHRIDFFYNTMQHVKKMCVPILFFFTGFFLIALIFGGCYEYIGSLHPGAFLPNNPKSMGDYLYYSFNVSAALMGTSFTAKLGLAKWLVVIQESASLIWITIILAAAISYMDGFLSTDK